MDFVYPYINSAAGDREIKLSIESVKRNYSGTVRITVIGDDPKVQGVNHIPLKRVPKQSGRAFRDQINKLKVAIESPDVGGEFVWMMDDIWFVNKVTVEDIKVARHNHRFKKNLDTWDASNNWLKSKRRTMIELRRRGFTAFDHSTHCPHHLTKTNVAKMFHEWDLDKLVWEWKTIYGNVFHDTREPAKPFRWRFISGTTREQLKAGFESATIANCTSSAFSDEVAEELSLWLGIKIPKPSTPGARSVRARRRKKQLLAQPPEPVKKTRYRSPSLPVIAAQRSAALPCPGGHRGDYIKTKGSSLCGDKGKMVGHLFVCEKFAEPVAINHYANSRRRDRERICMQCPVFLDDAKPIAVTSLVPEPMVRQRAALDSWVAEGFEIVAVQGSGESEKCKAIYPQVDRWLDLDETGKPRISEIIRAANQAYPDRTIMLINSDIEVEPDAVMPEVRAGELLCFSRYNYSKGKPPKWYKWGLDTFFLHPDIARDVPDVPFMIGEPTWDYWLPIWAMQTGRSVTISRRKVFTHRKHKKRWSAQAKAKYWRVVQQLSGDPDLSIKHFRGSLRKFEVDDR